MSDILADTQELLRIAVDEITRLEQELGKITLALFPTDRCFQKPPISALLPEIEAIKDALEKAEPCQCGDVGYFVVAGSEGNPEQEQCEFCYTNPNSLFSLREALGQKGRRINSG